MKSLPFMRFWPGDYLKDTSDLTVEQHGAYLLVLFHMWQAGGTLPDDDQKNARRLGVHITQWRRYKTALLPYLTIYGPDGQRLITQKRLQVEMNIAVESSARQIEKARKAANEKWSKRKVLGASGMQYVKHAPSMPQAKHGAPPQDAIVTNKNISSSFTAAETSPEEAREEEKPTGKDLSYLLETPLMKGRA